MLSLSLNPSLPTHRDSIVIASFTVQVSCPLLMVYLPLLFLPVIFPVPTPQVLTQLRETKEATERLFDTCDHQLCSRFVLFLGHFRPVLTHPHPQVECSRPTFGRLGHRQWLTFGPNVAIFQPKSGVTCCSAKVILHHLGWQKGHTWTNSGCTRWKSNVAYGVWCVWGA